jgi:type IV secretion system protein VirD4
MRFTSVRAKKLRYYEDHNFTGRVLPPPELHWAGYQDRPPRRPDDWTGRYRGTDARLAQKIAREFGDAETEDEGGLQQQRHPDLPARDSAPNSSDRDSDLPDLADEGDVTAEGAAMGEARAASIGRAHAINTGEHRGPGHDDLLPSF